MRATVERMASSVDSDVVAFGAVVVGLLAVFWAAPELQEVGVAVPAVRAVAGLVLLLFVPGALLSRLVGVRTDRFGVFALFAITLSFGVLTLLNLFVSFVLAPLGVEEPLSFLPLAAVLSAALVALLAASHATGTTVSIPRIRLRGPPAVVLGLVALPGLAAAAVIGVDQFGTHVGMFALVGAVVAVTLLAATRLLPASLFPLAAFSVSLSVLLHRNLLTDHVVGADIQASYFLSNLLLDTHYWAPDMGGSMMSLPVVTSVPASITLLTGVGLAAAYKVVYVFLFSLVPVGLYYVNSRVFDERVALFGSLFFVFYHGSFYFTPGKQLMSELLVVAMLLLVVYEGVDTAGKKGALFVLAATLISAHYGMTYAIGASLLVAIAGLAAARRLVGEFEHRLSVWQPVVLLGVATAFYAYSAPDLVDRLGDIPFGIADQLVTLALTGGVPGSGASYVSGETGLLDSLQVYLYFLLTGLVGLGLARDALGRLDRIRTGADPGYVEYTALAVPLFAFLGSSYFVIPNLWADRVYQLVLTVLAPYAALGYATVFDGAGAVLRRASAALGRTDDVASDGGGRRLGGAHWSLFAVVLAAVLALNSGLAFALAGTADASSFNAGANDLTFSAPEREAADWLVGNATEIERYDRLRPDADNETVPIYTEPRSYQLFRAVALPGYTNVDIRYLKSRWRPALFPAEVEQGYVFVRQRSVDPDARAADLPPPLLSGEDVGNLSEPRDAVYDSESARILRSNTSAVP